MKRLLLVILTTLAFAFPVVASHIVGGEFEILHAPTSSNPYRYRVNLIIYFDEINGDQGNKTQDQIINARIYRVSDNFMMRDVAIPFNIDSLVKYTQPACSIGQLKTSKMIYTTYITLSPDTYNDPAGYYIVWERCCRNYTIINIYSRNPTVSPELAAGQTFYLKFPPVVKNGEQFINNSPQLFPPLSDYACLGKPYYANFAGTDIDGDSLVYSLVTPLVTHTNDPYPPVDPAPYPQAQWASPFNFHNIIGGKPDLKISNDGLLTVTPATFIGLYVFAVRCDEYRDGVKIGEIRRDFQMLVVECRESVPPVITGKKLTDTEFAKDNMSVTFNNTVTDADRCIEVRVSDKDAFRAADGFQESIHLKAIPLGFRKDVSGILPSVKDVTLTPTDSIRTFRICFDECPYFEGGPFLVGIVVYDDACALPLQDTLKVLVNIQPPANTNPYFTTPSVMETLNEGASKTWPIHGLDNDHDPLTITTITDGFILGNYGMSIVQTKNENGDYQASLSWDTRCNIFDFTDRTDFFIRIMIEDGDHCAYTHPATMTFQLHVNLPGNLNPIIDSDLTTDLFERAVTAPPKKLGESLDFNVLGTDGDLDSITLFVQGKDFDITKYSVSFPTHQGKGNVQSRFEWNPTCDDINLDVKDEFDFQFIVVDNRNKCRFYKADTLDVLVNVQPPENRGPKLFINSLNAAMVLTDDNTMHVTLGQKIELGLQGIDSLVKEADHLHLQLLEATGDVPPQGYSFTPADGVGEVASTFIWQPDCSIFSKTDFENDYAFTFLVTDDRCFNEKGDTLKVNINIKDVDGSDIGFLPPNFVSPNGDTKNDFFAMMKRDLNTGELVNILPLDNCSGHFETITVYNRWGKKVFGSSDREFRWFPDGEPTGVYYYQIQYSNKEYKGTITVSYFEGQSSSSSQTQP